jgi:hypothetical protein
MYAAFRVALIKERCKILRLYSTSSGLVLLSMIEPKHFGLFPKPGTNQKPYINSKRMVQSARLNQL